MTQLCGDHYRQLVVLLLAAAVTVATALDLASERSSIESTYELTKYLEYQLKEIKDVYLTYLGPPFNEKDFSPPRPNSTALSLPSAATRLELWHGLENQARLAQNQKAYSVLLAAVRELARSTLCPSLKTSLLHFCTGLDGLLGSISALMTTLGYALPPSSANMRMVSGDMQRGVGRDRPAPLMSQSLYRSRVRSESGPRGTLRRSRTRVVRGDDEDAADLMTTNRGTRKTDSNTGRGIGEKRQTRRRGKREEPEIQELDAENYTHGPRRRLLSISEEHEFNAAPPGTEIPIQTNSNNNNNVFSYNLNAAYGDTLRKEDGFIAGRGISVEIRQDAKTISKFSEHHMRSPRSLLPSTIQPPLSTLSLLYQFGTREEHTLLPQPVPLSLRKGLYAPPLRLSPPASSSLSMRPTMNDFARKVEGFWILRELQSWLWRSAKDFNRLKKRL